MEEGKSFVKKRLKMSPVWKQKNDKEKESSMLIGKVLTDKAINKKAVISIIRKGWNLGESTDIVEMQDDLFVFTFAKKSEKYRVLKGRPWMIQGSIMCIQEWSEYMVTKEANFDKTPFWVQFHNLPLGILEEEVNVQNMGSMVGELLWYEKPMLNNKFIRSYGRARVLVDVKQPLIAGFWMDRPNNSEVWIQVKYERLSSLCYKCGEIGHDFKGCLREIATDEKGKRVYGAWLTAGAEKDSVEALVNFNPLWKEEDCRKARSEREEEEQEARESCWDLARYIYPSGTGQAERNEERETGKVSEWKGGRSQWVQAAVSLSRCSKAETDGMEKASLSQQFHPDPKHVGTEKIKLGQPSLMQISPRKEGKKQTNNTNPSLLVTSENVKERGEEMRINPKVRGLQIISDLGQTLPKKDESQTVEVQSKVESHEPLVQYDERSPKRGSSQLADQKQMLSPISEVAFRIQDCSLKRCAPEPESPGPTKRRRLFLEKEKSPGKRKGSTTPKKKKSINKIKREIRQRDQASPREGEKQAEVGEIEFPEEWLQGEGVQGSTKEDQKGILGLGGCPSTATKQI